MDLVGTNIRNIRRAKGLLQKQLADLAKIDASNLSKLERGDYTWTKENLERIAKALDVSVTDLFAKDLRVPLVGIVRAGFGKEKLAKDPWQALSMIDAKLDRILTVLETGS